MNINIDTYTILDHSEETHCHNCGTPLYVGDRAYVARGDDKPCCSLPCAVRLVENETMSNIWNLLNHKG